MDKRAKLEEKGKLWTRMQEVWKVAVAADRPMTPEESREYDDLGTKIDGIDEELRRETEHEDRSARMGKIERDPRLIGGNGNAETDEARAAYNKTFDRYLRYGLGELDPSERRLVRTGLVENPELRAQATAPGSAGGYLIPTGFSNKIVETLKWFGGMRLVSSIQETTLGNEIEWPTNDDTGNKGRRVQDNVAATTTDLTFKQRIIRAYLYSSDIVLVPISLLMDEAVDLEAFIAKKLGQRIGRIENSEQTIGTGNAMPLGSSVGATVGVTAASATAVTYNELVKLEHSLDPAYRNRAVNYTGGDYQDVAPGVGYMFHDLTLQAIRQLADSQSRPLWVPQFATGLAGKVPATFNGWPYVVNNDMPQMTTGNVSILFGDFNTGYLIREVKQFTLMRLDERFADSFQVAFLGFHRMDGAVVDAAAIQALKQA